jgi:hypothetical protein
MNELEQAISDDAVTLMENDNDALETPLCDDRYPGSFFTIPAPIVLGKTCWSLN